MDKVNVIQSSKNFDGNLQDFLRNLDNAAALGRYVMDEAYKTSFFSNFPGLVARKLSGEDRVGDIIYIDEKFNVAQGGPGMPGPYKSTRQLAGNEDKIDAAYRRDKMTVGMHRYAVAVENYLQTDLLPDQIVTTLKSSLTSWATYVEDCDAACTLFRDYPYYYAETDGLTNTEISERVESLFGRGTYNDVGVDPTLILPNGVTDIENLSDTDTLTDSFMRYLQQYADQELGMQEISMEDGRPFFGMIVGDPDVQNFYKNSSSTGEFKSSMDSAFYGKEFNHPIYKQFLTEYAGIRLTRYGWMARNDGRNELADYMSVYKNLMGSPYEPIARVLAVARGNETLPDLITWDRGAYNLTTPGARNGLDGSGDTLNVYVSLGAKDFPFYSDAGSTTVGASSYNKFVTTATEDALAYCGLEANDIGGRLQIGEGTASGTKYKILYTGPVYVGTMQMAANKTKYAQVQKVYKLRVHALYTWNGTAWVLVNDAGLGAAVTTLKSFLGLDANNKINIGGAYGTVAYNKRRKVHVFNTVRTVLFGKDLMYDADILKGHRVEQETRDYGALTGWGITTSKGRKLVTGPDGLIRNYAVVTFKRPALV